MRDFWERIGQCFGMLSVREIHDRNQINDWLGKLDISKQTWLLSDLRTKFEIQELFLQQKSFFLEESVLRISDLWKKILLRSHPQFKIISQQAAVLHLRFFLRQHGDSIGLPESSENTLLRWMTDLAPLYFHPEGEEKIHDWFQQNPDQLESWKEWWLRSKAAFSYFESKKQILAPWIPAFLQTIPDVSKFWEKDLIVDLGGQLSYVEAELLHQISKKLDVTVLSPELYTDKLQSKYSDLMHPYEFLKGFSRQVEKLKPFSNPTKREFKSFSSTLGSIRQATATVRKWIEQGIPLNQIALVAPDIESIWTVLSYHLEIEGIPINKSKLSSFQASVAVQHFLSKLRALNYNLSTRDLELAYYGPLTVDSKNQKSELAFERFEALYRNIYDEGDYDRFTKIKQSLNADVDLRKPMNQSQFIYKIAQIFSKVEVQELPVWLEVLVRDLLGSFDESFQLTWSDWISFSEASLSRHEIMEEEPAHDGVMVTNLMSAHFLKVTHRVFLELSEENLKSPSNKGILPQSARKISKDLGFWLNHGEKGDLEFELEWAIQCGLQEDHLYFGAINLTGQILTPSSIWLKSKGVNQLAHGQFQIPELTVLDGQINLNSNSARLLEDIGEKEVSPIQKFEAKFLSPSALEAFHKCPFTYFARQTLGLRSFPEIDLDLDRRSAGEALHYLFEVILSKGLDSWNKEKLSELLEEARGTHFTGIIESLWHAQKKKMMKLCLRFVEFEKDWRKKHPKIKSTKTEVNWRGDFKGSTFRGRIDRVDLSDQNDLIVLDYKLSGSNLTGAHQWIENGSLQMLFYIYALENGWAQGIEGHVVAAFYFVVKNFSRETGFELAEDRPGFFQNTKKRNQKLNLEKKAGLIRQFEDAIESLTTRLKNGEIKPFPSDEKICPKCEWRRLCRAPHLS